jgi:broad specificity phosphatase PhoE
MSELVTSAEVEPSLVSWDTEIILQRHSRYKGGFPEAGWAHPTEEEKVTLGHLTEEGDHEARQAADARIDAVLAGGARNVDFLVITSPTHWLGNPELGQRAIETAEVICEEILAKLDAAGMSRDQLLTPWNPDNDNPVRQSDKLVEGQMFDTHIEFSDKLRSKYGGQGREFWDAYNADADREERKALGAEGAPDAANRVRNLIDIVARYGSVYHEENPDRKLVVFVVSHHEAIEPYVLYGLGVPPKEFEPSYNDGVTIKIDGEGVGHTTIAGHDIEVQFPEHGKSETID